MGTSHGEEERLSLLYEASRNGSVTTLNSLLKQEPLILHKISQSGFSETPLHISSLLGHLEFSKALLTYKPKLAVEVDASRNTPLHLASAEGHIDIVKELLKVDNKPCLFPNGEGKIPLHYAVMKGRTEVARELVKAKPESLSFLDNGYTVFHLCVMYNHLETLKGLVELELAISGELLFSTRSDAMGNTIFHVAVSSKQVEVSLMEENQISSPMVWKTAEGEKILIGKVLSNRSYTRSAMESILRKAWNLQEGFDVIEIDGNAFMFKFEDGNEYNRILRGRPWSINGSVLNLLERAKYKSCEEFDFSKCPVWIQMHNVPVEAMCLENAVMIGGYVGEVQMVEDPYYQSRYLRGFLRARILLDLRRPLAYGFWLPRPNEESIWISICYEKLQNFCYNCGKVGHDNRACDSERLMSIMNPKEPRFGAWLTTKMCRSWDEAVVVIKSDWSEAEYARRRRMEALLRKKEEEERAADLPSVVDDDNLFFIKTHKPKGDLSGAYRKVPNENLQARKNEEGPKGEVRSGAIGTNETQDAEASTNMGTRIQVGEEDGYTGKASVDPLENQLAVVVYNPGGLGEVIKGISMLGLKREAPEVWNVSEQKRRRKMPVSPTAKPVISVLAENLRRTRAKIRRSAKRKGKEDKENISAEDMCLGDQMEFSVETETGGSGFVFKAGRGRRRKSIADGSGGWPLSATQAP
ncbi:hypothetical protein K1719_009189 [Acacia pycnantha]|nr:hypothetical protein K1719_009189 [Acacia pycnantha]